MLAIVLQINSLASDLDARVQAAVALTAGKWRWRSRALANSRTRRALIAAGGSADSCLASSRCRAGNAGVFAAVALAAIVGGRILLALPKPCAIRTLGTTGGYCRLTTCRRRATDIQVAGVNAAIALTVRVRACEYGYAKAKSGAGRTRGTTGGYCRLAAGRWRSAKTRGEARVQASVALTHDAEVTRALRNSRANHALKTPRPPPNGCPPASRISAACR